MNLSAPFIARPVATTLLTLGIALAGLISYWGLPRAPLPQFEFPTISVRASLPGASPETMAATVATPLERVLGTIAGVNEITSSSTEGSTRISLQFELDRDINSAARDVQAGINAARTLLPTGMPESPSYRKVNSAGSPIIVLSLTSDTASRGQMHDAGSTVIAQRLSQLSGVGQVTVSGGALPAIRIALEPDQLVARGIALETVRRAVVAANANRPKGVLEAGGLLWQIAANDQARTPADYESIVLATDDGAVVRLGDVARVTESVEDVRSYGISNGRESVLVFVYKAPGTNIIDTVAKVQELLPRLKGSIPEAIDVSVVGERTKTIRASLQEVQQAMVLAVALVVLAVLLFLRNWRATLLPAVVVPVSLAGTFIVMALCGYTLDNLSTMALTIAIGFVVDDAIVVLENISRHIERGLTPTEAAHRGAREIGFTLVSMSVSLAAVFIPVFALGGIVGRLFHEFAVVTVAAILVSLLISLTTAPMLAAHVMLPRRPRSSGIPRDGSGVYARSRRRAVALYRRSLKWTLRHQPVAVLSLIAVVALNVVLYAAIPKAFFPEQDTGLVWGSVSADQTSSFQVMKQRVEDFSAVLRADPAVQTVNGFTGGGRRNSARFFITLTPLAERGVSARAVIDRLRAKMARFPGVRIYLSPIQDIRIGAREASTDLYYTLQADDLAELSRWEPRVRRALASLPEVTDIDTDQQDDGLQTSLIVDRDAAARVGVTMAAIDATLNNAFGQRQIGVIYNPLNQYRVVMELAPRYLQSPATLDRLTVSNSRGESIALASIARFEMTNTPLSVSHESGTPAATISFSVPPGGSLSAATAAIDTAVGRLGLPVSVRGSFQGSASAFQKSLSSQPLLIAAAMLTIYLVLGMLYESLIHPVTVLSTLPSAGAGALLALMSFGTEFSIIALIAVILLIGIVMKNAIMMIDVAIRRQRSGLQSSGAAIFRAANLRLRPILMTSIAAILAAVPLAVGVGEGAELRRPLGIAIVGGLILSQVLTLYTTPVMFVLMDRLRRPGRLKRPRWLRAGRAPQVTG